MNKLPLFMLCGAMTLLLTTCQHNDPLPAATQNGQNTFGCKINGKPYIPNGGLGFMPSKPVYGGLSGVASTPYKIGIYIRTYARDKQRIELFLGDFKLGAHTLNTTTGTRPAYLDPADYGLYEAPDGSQYVTSQQYTGQVIITKADTATGIVSGSFSFVATNASGQTVTITDGRFDVNARTQ